MDSLVHHVLERTRPDASRGFREAFVDVAPVHLRQGGRRRWLSRWPWVVALILFLSTLNDAQQAGGVLALVIGLLVAYPLLLVRRYPVVAWRSAAVSAVLVPLLARVVGGLNGSAPWATALAMTSAVTFVWAAFRLSPAGLLWMWALSVVILNALAASGARAGWTLALTVGAVLVYLISSRRGVQAALADKEEESQLERARRTVLEERARIARDLHDVVAHHMSMVVVQAESAPYRLTGMTEPVQQEFASISGSAREALGEIRALLGLLRSEGQEGQHAPQPGLSDLDDLVASARRAGMTITVRETGTPLRPRAAVDLVAYRILQQSLANAARHAPSAPVVIEIGYAATEVTLDVANAPGEGGPIGPPGYGITGMRERAGVLGGDLSTTPTPDGGFRVQARLPLSGPATKEHPS